MSFKLLRSPKNKSSSSAPLKYNLNLYYFAAGDSQKDSGLEIEFLLDTGATSSIINYKTFREVCQFQQDLELSRSNNTTRNNSGQIIPMMEYISLRLYYDSDGQHNFPLTVWITEMKTQNFLGMNFCQEQINKIHFDLPGIELKRPLNTFCYGSLQLNKVYPYVSQILTFKIPHSMYIEPKTTRCYKFAFENAKNSFTPDLHSFQTERQFLQDSTSQTSFVHGLRRLCQLLWKTTRTIQSL